MPLPTQPYGLPPIPPLDHYCVPTFTQLLTWLYSVGCEELAEDLAKRGMNADTLHDAAHIWRSFTYEPAETDAWLDRFAERLTQGG